MINYEIILINMIKQHKPESGLQKITTLLTFKSRSTFTILFLSHSRTRSSILCNFFVFVVCDVCVSISGR